MIRVFHYNSLTESERNRLNGSDGGWDSEPRFARYADITSGFGDRNALQVGMAWALGEYHMAAEVDTDDLDVAYERTNHIEHDWAENDGVTSFDEKRKSSSVGDIFEKDGRFFVVAPFGFDPINLKADEYASLKHVA